MDTLLTIVDKALIPLLVTLVLPVLLILLKRGVDLFEKKTKVTISQDNRAQLDELVVKAIYYVEEQARKAVKDGQEPTDGPTKLELAIDFIKSAAAVAGVDLTGADLVKLIEAKLPEVRTED